MTPRLQEEVVEAKNHVEAEDPGDAVHQAWVAFTDRHPGHFVKKISADNCADGSWVVQIKATAEVGDE